MLNHQLLFGLNADTQFLDKRLSFSVAEDPNFELKEPGSSLSEGNHSSHEAQL